MFCDGEQKSSVITKRDYILLEQCALKRYRTDPTCAGRGNEPMVFSTLLLILLKFTMKEE